MKTSGLGASNLLSAGLEVNRIPSLNQLLQTTQAKGTTGASNTSSGSGSPDISQAGQFIAKLQDLQQKDPAKFKQLANRIAAQLSAAAQQETQPGQKEALANLAAKFQSLAQGGDPSQLQPQRFASRVLGAYGANQSTQGALAALHNPAKQAELSPESRKALASIIDEVKRA